MPATRLCMIAPEFIPVWGGVGSYIVELIKFLPPEVDVHVVTLKRDVGQSANSTMNSSVESVIERPIKVHYLTHSKETFFYNLPFQLACLAKIPILNKKYHFDIVHSHTCHMSDVFLKLFNQLRIPNVVTIHGTIQMLRDHAEIARDRFHNLEAGEKSILRFYPIIRQLQQLYVKRATHFIAVSQKTKDIATKHFEVDPNKISVVYNGVDTNLFHPPNKTELSTKYSKPTIVYVGRIISKKGIDTLVNAMPDVLRSIPQARFIFVGGGNISLYNELIKNRGISNENFSFTGHMGYLERSKIVREASVFVNPSFFENCSISILEAMSSGCTVVASNVGGNPELIQTAKNGVLVPAFDHKRFAEAIVSLLKDENLNSQISREARRTVENRFSSEICAKNTFKVYKQILYNQ